MLKNISMFNFEKQCMIKKICPKPGYSKLVTSGNNPSITKRALYSQKMYSSKPSLVNSAPIQYITNTNLFIEKYALLNKIDLIGTNIENQTSNFIIGNISAEIYFNYLKGIFSSSIKYDYLPNLLTGMYPLMPLDKRFYLKNYADLIIANGNIYPKIQTKRPLVHNINFLYQF
jgi:hypothetical protein